MRKPCLGCVLKHLGAAAVLEEEIRNGYPSYRFLLYGHMDQAAAEGWGANKSLARVLRQHRVNFQYKADYDIPFEALAEYVETIARLESEPDGAEAAASLMPPGECLRGIDVDNAGRPIYDGDTRP